MILGFRFQECLRKIRERSQDLFPHTTQGCINGPVGGRLFPASDQQCNSYITTYIDAPTLPESALRFCRFCLCFGMFFNNYTKSVKAPCNLKQYTFTTLQHILYLVEYKLKGLWTMQFCNGQFLSRACIWLAQFQSYLQTVLQATHQTRISGRKQSQSRRAFNRS